MAEQLALHELRRNRPAVHRDERPFAARAAVVDEFRNELLARAGFAEDVHRCLAARHARDHLAQLSHRLRVADEPRAGHARGERPVGPRAQANGAADQLAQNAEIERLGHEVECAELERAHGGLDVAVCGDHRNGHLRVVFLDPANEVEPVTIRQAHVGEAQVEVTVLQQLLRGADIRSGPRVHVHAREREAHELEQIRLIVDYEYGRFGHLGPIEIDTRHRNSQRVGSANTRRKRPPPAGRGS